MQPDITLSALRSGNWRSRVPEAWKLPLIRLAIAWAALMLLTARAWIEMAVQWWNISTYNHILFIPFTVGWLIWIRRGELAHLKPGSWTPGLLLVTGALFVWLLGELAGVNIVAQTGAVGALQMSVIAILGPRVAWGVFFPLAYMVFLVPFGDELVPTLQMLTADLVIWLTRLSGIPAVIDGVFIDTPAGLFEVAEACSGVKFLVAMIALGVLVAQTCFTRWRRRIAFMAACIAVPIIANGVRAWGTIYIAQSQGIEFAAGFDHIFYGWVFFAIVVVLILGGGWQFFDRDPEEPGLDGARLAKEPFFDHFEARTASGKAVAAGFAILIAGFGIWNVLASHLEADLPAELTVPEVGGWTKVDPDMALSWEPRAFGADHRLLTSYADDQGRRVDVFAAAYAAQGNGRDPGAQGEGALVPDTDWRWLRTGPQRANARTDYLFALGSIKRLTETSWRIGETTTASAARLTLEAMRDKLTLNPRPTLMLIVSAEERDGVAAQDAVDAFRRSTGPQDEWMDQFLATP